MSKGGSGLVDCSGRALLPEIESAVFINGANDMNLFTTMHLIGSLRAAAAEDEGAGKRGKGEQEDVERQLTKRSAKAIGRS